MLTEYAPQQTGCGTDSTGRIASVSLSESRVSLSEAKDLSQGCEEERFFGRWPQNDMGTRSGNGMSII